MAKFRIKQIKPGRPAKFGEKLDSMLSELLAGDAGLGGEDTTEEEFPEFIAETSRERGSFPGVPSGPVELAIPVEDAIALLSQSSAVSETVNSDRNEPLQVKAAEPFPHLLDQMRAELLETESETAGKSSLDAAASADALGAQEGAPLEESPMEDMLSELLSATMAGRPDTCQSTPAEVEHEGREETTTPNSAGVRDLDELIATIDDDARNTPFDAEVTPVELRNSEEETSRCVVFSLARTKYAMPIGDVIETDKVPRITAVPNMPQFVRGITNLRGDIISVLDLRALLGLEYSEQVEHGRILVVRGGQERTPTAFVVDDVKGMASVSDRQINLVAGQIEDRVVPVLTGVFEHEDQLVNLLNVERLFASDELQNLEFN